MGTIDWSCWLKRFSRLGYPDYADGRAESIEINWSEENKRISFEYGYLIKDFEELINQLRRLRDDYVNNL